MGRFPESSYQHIPGANHEANWKADLKSRDLDAFFVCAERQRWLGRWLGEDGPEIDDELLAFVKTCSVYGVGGLRSARNASGIKSKPIRHGGLSRGLHLETRNAEELISLCNVRMKNRTFTLDSTLMQSRRSRVVKCGTPKQPPRSWSSESVHLVKDKC
jgi:hypothetical protein